MRRTRALLQTTQQLASGDLSARTTIPHDEGELGQLASSFDTMADSLELRALERDQAEASMREYAAELERSNRELQDFANVASHDMQEPLRKIITFSELLQTRYAADLDERGKDYLLRMDSAATHLHNLINDLLAYSRVTTRAQPFVEVNLNDVARRVLSDLDLQIEESRAQIELTPLPTLEADPTQMYQLLAEPGQQRLEIPPAGPTAANPHHGSACRECDQRLAQFSGQRYGHRVRGKIPRPHLPALPTLAPQQ